MFKKLAAFAAKMKKDVIALYIAVKRKDVHWLLKILPVMVVAYAMSPIDLIPDFVPVLGYMDDLILLPLGIAVSIRCIPKGIMDICRHEAEALHERLQSKNWYAAAVIVVVWAASAYWLIRMAWISR